MTILSVPSMTFAPSAFGSPSVTTSVIRSPSMTTDAPKWTSLPSFTVTTVALRMIRRSLTGASSFDEGRISDLESRRSRAALPGGDLQAHDSGDDDGDEEDADDADGVAE